MGLQIYDRAYFFVNGALLGESSGGSIEYQGDPIPVTTLTKDFGGAYPTPKHAIITVDSFIPADGIDFDPTGEWLTTNKITAKMQFGGNGLSMEAEGFCMAPSISTSATDPSKLTWKMMVEAKQFT